VIYAEYFDDKKHAIEREKFLKSGKGRAWIHYKIKLQLESAGFLSPPVLPLRPAGA
jgi:hypothetical protein